MKLIKELNEEIQYIAEEKDGKKTLYIEGVFLQSNLKNRNGRVYPREIMAKEVARYTTEQIDKKRALGELGHPDGPSLNLDRVSHMITSLREDGDNWIGKAKILETPMGQLVKTMIQGGVKLGVSSRGSGNVNESTGKVADFEIVTVDVVAQPSAPNAYPVAIYEGLLNMRGGHKVLDMAREASGDAKVQKYLKEEMIRLIRDLKI